MRQAVLFDLDETLSDRSTLIITLIEGQYNRFSNHLFEITRDDYLVTFQAFEEHGYVPKDVVYPQIVEHFSLPNLADELFEDFKRHYAACAVGFPFLHETLSALRDHGHPLAILTNGGTHHQTSVIDSLELSPYFGSILISEAAGIRKPDARLFHLALEQLGVDQGVMVGDHPEVDIRGAKQAGLKAIWKRIAYYEEPLEADATIECLSELPDLLRCLQQTLT